MKPQVTPSGGSADRMWRSDEYHSRHPVFVQMFAEAADDDRFASPRTQCIDSEQWESAWLAAMRAGYQTCSTNQEQVGRCSPGFLRCTIAGRESVQFEQGFSVCTSPS